MHAMDGPRLRIRIAHDQIQALNAGFEAYCQRHPHRVVLEKNEETGKFDSVLRDVPDIPLDFGIFAGFVAHGLRSALDGLAAQLAFKNHVDSGGTKHFEAVSDNVMFPIRLFGPNDVVPPTVVNRHERAKYNPNGPFFKDIGTKYLAMIEPQQPFQPGNGGEENPLWRLACLNNADKHRLVVVIAAFAAKTLGQLAGGRVVETARSRAVIYDTPMRLHTGIPYVDGATVAEHGTSDPSQVQMNIHVTPKMKFGDGCDVVKDLPVVKTLTEICNSVREVVESFASVFP